MSMKPNFNSPLKLDNHGERVEANGPLNWGTTEGKCKISVTIKQTVNGTDVWAWGDSGSYETKDLEWDAHTDTKDHQQFQPGPAHAWGIITLTDSNDLPPVPWDQPVQLVV